MTPGFAHLPEPILSSSNFESCSDHNRATQEFLDKNLYDNSEDYIEIKQNTEKKGNNE
jgi:hypothetical protein